MLHELMCQVCVYRLLHLCVLQHRQLFHGEVAVEFGMVIQAFAALDLIQGPRRLRDVVLQPVLALLICESSEFIGRLILSCGEVEALRTVCLEVCFAKEAF